VCCIWIVSDDGSRNKFSVRLEHTARPIDVISEVIRRRGRLMDITKAQVEGLIESYRSTYALKVCGCDEFLLSEKPISQYRVSYDCIILLNGA
jgi:phosphatidylinositol-4,5-bisphosphate 3-kinase